jgi:hypothetical protein
MLGVVLALAGWIGVGDTLSTGALSGDTLRLEKTIIPPGAPADSFVQVGRVILTGNNKTRSQVILREMNAQGGDLIFKPDLEGVLLAERNRIYNLRLFNTVTVRAVDVGNRVADLLVEVAERWYLFPIPLIDLGDRNFNDWWQNHDHAWDRINYGVRLYQYNFRGRNETLRFHIQFGFVRRFEIYYRIPYLDRRQRHGLAVDADYSETKNLSVMTLEHKQQFLKSDEILRESNGFGITYSYRKSFYQTHGLRFDYRNNVVNDTVALLNPSYYLDGKTRMEFPALTYTFTSDHRDIQAYPLKGFYLRTGATHYGLGLSNDIDKLDAFVSYSFHLPLRDEFYFSNQTTAYTSTAARQPYPTYPALGYRNLFARGYELYLIEGQHYVINKTTFKKKVYQRSWNLETMPLEQFRHFPLAIYAKLYGDLAYVNNFPEYEQNSLFTDQLILGYGGGLDFVLAYDAVLRIEYSVNDLKRGGFFFHVKKEF